MADLFTEDMLKHSDTPEKPFPLFKKLLRLWLTRSSSPRKGESEQFIRANRLAPNLVGTEVVNQAEEDLATLPQLAC